MTTYTPPVHVPRKETGPGRSEGQLSAEFTEVEVKVTSSFAHDRGMMSRLESLSVGGKDCSSRDLLQELVALRKGWTVSGGSSDAEVVATFKAFAEAWGEIFPHAGRLTGEALPDHLAGRMNRPLGPNEPGGRYHPPRVAIYALDDGDRLVVESFFRSWDGGNHGRQLAYEVAAYKVSDGSYFSLSEEKERGGQVPEKTGPQPVDSNIPRPKHLTR